MRRLAQEIGASRGSTHNALRVLHFHAYRVKMVQEIKPLDIEKRFRYCQWFKKFIRSSINILDTTFFSDEARFHLSGYVNGQNFRFWSTTNLHSVMQKPFYILKKLAYGVLHHAKGLLDFCFSNQLLMVLYTGNLFSNLWHC